MEVWHYITMIVVLQLFSAFFAGAETAMTTASKGRLHQLSQEGNKTARLAEKIQSQKERLIGTLLVGNTFVNSAAAAVGTALMIDVFGSESGTGAMIATVLITISLLIFSEVLPKTYAIHHSTQTALAIASFVQFFLTVLAPATWGIVKVVRGILILIGANPNKIVMSSNIEELKGAIDLHRGPDAEVAQERAMLRSILDLNEVEVQEVMTHRSKVVTVEASLSVHDIIEQCLQSGFTRIPLWKDNPENIIGIVHAKALLKEVLNTNGDLTKIDITKVMTKPWFIPDSTNLLEQLQAFRARHEHFSLVVDEYGVLMGIVTLEDILEEIVGEISDEHDRTMPGAIRQPNGSYIMEGSVTIRELNRQMEWKLPDADASTIAGLLLHEARRVPEVGQTFEFHGFRFEILRRQRNQITQIRVWPQETAKDTTAPTSPSH